MTAIAEETTSTDPPAIAAVISGVVDLADGRGFLRTAGYRRSAADIPITAAQVRQYGLRPGEHGEGAAGGPPGKTESAKTGPAKSQSGSKPQARQETANRTLLTVES